MKEIPDKSIDMILCDLPYGTTDCKWDNIIPLEELWKEYKRIIKDNRIIALFGCEPFSTKLRMYALDIFKYDWIWVKNIPIGHAHAKNKPMNKYEIVSIFSKGSMGHKSLLGDKRMIYNPQGLQYCGKKIKNGKKRFGGIFGSRPSHKDELVQEYTNYPVNVLFYDVVPNNKRFHPTQKPVELCEYLIKTYTNPGDLVLDNCAGSGTTAIAALNTGRNFICIEKEQKYVDIINERIKQWKEQNR